MSSFLPRSESERERKDKRERKVKSVSAQPDFLSSVCVSVWFCVTAVPCVPLTLHVAQGSFGIGGLFSGLKQTRRSTGYFP